jgi:predicted nucleic acid-binding protein
LSYLIDTNVLSELRRRTPDPGVLQWFAARPANTLYLSVLTLGALRKGIDALEQDARKLSLLDWLETELPSFFSGRVLPVDAVVADRWGRLQAQARRPLPAINSLLAATAMAHGLTLITRNLKDFQYTGLQLLSPWSQ